MSVHIHVVLRSLLLSDYFHQANEQNEEPAEQTAACEMVVCGNGWHLLEGALLVVKTVFFWIYQQLHSSRIWQHREGWLYRTRASCFIPVCCVSGSVCGVCTWLFANPAEWYLLTQCCVCMWLQNKSTSARLVPG